MTEELREELSRARRLAYQAGICVTCGQEVHHHGDEPFATCGCGTGEDTAGPGTIQRLRAELETAQCHKSAAISALQMARSEVETLQHVNRVLAEQCDVQNAELAAAQLRIDALTESINGAAQKIVACAKARDAALSEVAQWKGRAEIAKKEIAATAARFCKQYKAEIAAVHGEQDALKAELAAEQEKSHIISRDHQVLEGELVTLRVLLKEACCDHMRDDHDDERQNKSVRDFRRRAAGVLHE